MATDKGKPDFSSVKASASSTAHTAPKADFSNVKASVASTAAVVAPSAQQYTVVKGDSLSKIAKQFYGNANRWKEIHQANLDTIKNPDLIKIGQVIVIPADTKAKT